MQINFCPEQDNPEFEKAAEEYKKIWEEEGSKITDTIEKISGLKFKEKLINAIIYKYISYSSPLRLEAAITIEHKRGTLIHELCHRLNLGNNLKINAKFNDKNWNLEVHKPVDLILYDIWSELYGKKFAAAEIKFEISRWNKKGISPYKVAWDWALSMTKEKRQKLWKKSFNK